MVDRFATEDLNEYHKLEFTGKARVLVQIGDRVIVPITLYCTSQRITPITSSLAFDFMNKSRASLPFPANTLTLDGKSIPTKLGKIKPGMLDM